MRFLYLSFLCFSVIYADTSTADPKVASSQAGNMFLGTMGSGDAVNSNLSRPIMGGSQMKTMDGRTSFNAQVQCPSNTKAVVITFLPVGGNDYRLMVQQDTDLDGNFDYTYDTSSIGRSVSGVCANGVIMCNPAGSWTDCQPYIWNTNSNRQLSLTPVSNGYSGLGSCFCSNASCGVSSLVEQMYDTIGGGISTTIMKNDSRFILSKNEFDQANMAYSLFGQNKINCSGIGASAWDQHGEQNPTRYYDAQTPPNTSIGDIATEQGSDPNSYYSMIKNQSNVAYNKDGDTLGMPNTVQCTIKKTPTEQTNTDSKYTLYRSPSPGQTGWGGILSQFNVNVGTFTDKFFIQTAGIYTIKSQIDNYGSVSLDGQTIFNLNYWQTIYSTSKNLSIGEHTIVTSGANDDGPYGMATVVYASDGSVLWNIRNGQAQVITNSVTISSSDQCQNNENNGCTIQDEQACDNSGQHCFYTIKNRIRQQINPPPNCTTGSFSTSCADGNTITTTHVDGTQSVLYSGSDAWFTIKRTYDCGTNSVNIDASKQIQASGTATKTDNTSATMTYTDMNGTTQTITALPTAESCLAPVCTVKRPQVSNDMFFDNSNRNQTAGGSTVYQTVAKTCIGSGSSAVCPVDASLSETMIDDCSCPGTNMRGFQQAVTNIGVVSEASKDMICSQN